MKIEDENHIRFDRRELIDIADAIDVAMNAIAFYVGDRFRERSYKSRLREDCSEFKRLNRIRLRMSDEGFWPLSACRFDIEYSILRRIDRMRLDDLISYLGELNEERRRCK